MNYLEIIENAGGEDWLKPVDGFITSYFDERINPINMNEEFHNGLDIACQTGTPALAVADGIVIESGVSATYGKYVLYGVGDGYSVFYAHLSELLTKEGDAVKKGDAIARTGNTGLSTGPHLHLTVYKENSEIDPLLFFEYE